MKRLRLSFCLALSVSAFARADIVVSDSEFAPSDWTVTVIHATNGANGSATQATTGGNPGAFRDLMHTMPSPSGLWLFHRFHASTYDPAVQGAIATLDYSEDQRMLGAGVVATRPALLQDGVVYSTPGGIVSGVSWVTYSEQGLTHLQFANLVPAGDGMSPGTQHPDFSGNGSPIQFGFIRANTHFGPPSPLVLEHGIDSWTFTCFSETPVPAVSQWGLVTMSILTLVAGTLIARNRRLSI